MLVCIKCHIEQDDRLYYNKCKKCYRKQTAASNQIIRNRNYLFIRSFKEGHPCSDCGGFFHFCQLDFNHINSSLKSFEIWKSNTRSMALIKAEINKCELVCANCHREKTQSEWGGLSPKLSTAVKEYSKWMNELKTGKPCKDCSKSYPYYVLDFDHLGEKNFEMNRARQLRIDKNKVLAEIENCDIVCVNCHRMRTFLRRTEINLDESTTGL